MPDVSINDLQAASSLQDNGLLVVYQNSLTQSITGQKLKDYAETAATDIAEPVAAAAVGERLDDISVSATTLSPGSQATATYNPDENTLTLGIPRGQDGQGAGDMTKAVYDPDDEVYDAGGIPAYFESVLGNKIDDPTTKSSGQVLTYNGSAWEAATPSGGLTGRTFTVRFPYDAPWYRQETGLYTANVGTPGIKANYSINPIVDVPLSDYDASSAADVLATWSKVVAIQTQNGNVEIFSLEQPSISFPFNIKINVWE